MPASTAAGVVTAVAGSFTAALVLLTAVVGFIRSRTTERKLDEVHVLVNQQATDAKNYQRALIAALTRAGIEVPEDQSVDPGPPG